ncbi:MAG: hypothetical protein WCS97_00140 [Candidatus Paceibacterota bacterium]|jgi:hypothetical protein
MPRELQKVTQYEFDMLGAALAQEGWQIECQYSVNDIEPIMLNILDFKLTPFDTGKVQLALTLREKGDLFREEFEIEVKRVFAEGQLGIATGELRRFTVAVRNLPRMHRPGARLGFGYWRVLKPNTFGLLFTRSKAALPGWPLHKHLQHHQHPTYGFEEHLKRYGNGDNLLRTARFAQSQALQVGDILATGDKVLSPPRRGFNGSVLIHLTGGFNGHWIDVASRLPIALLTAEDHAPAEIWNRIWNQT